MPMDPSELTIGILGPSCSKQERALNREIAALLEQKSRGLCRVILLQEALRAEILNSGSKQYEAIVRDVIRRSHVLVLFIKDSELVDVVCKNAPNCPLVIVHSGARLRVDVLSALCAAEYYLSTSENQELVKFTNTVLDFALTRE